MSAASGLPFLIIVCLYVKFCGFMLCLDRTKKLRHMEVFKRANIVVNIFNILRFMNHQKLGLRWHID